MLLNLLKSTNLSSRLYLRISNLNITRLSFGDTKEVFQTFDYVVYSACCIFTGNVFLQNYKYNLSGEFFSDSNCAYNISEINSQCVASFASVIVYVRKF